jgi:ribonuclease Y
MPDLERPGGAVDGSMIGGMIGLFVGMLGGIAGAYAMGRLRAQTARGLADQILANANREAETTRIQAELQARQDMLGRRDELDREMEETRKGLREQERRIEKRGDLLDQKLEQINRKDREFESIQHSLSEQQEELQKRQLELKQTHTEQRELLCKIGRLAPEEARSMLLARVREELRGEVGLLIMQHEASIRESCQQRAREILTTTIQRYAASHTAEVTVSTIDIPSDEM